MNEWKKTKCMYNGKLYYSKICKKKKISHYRNNMYSSYTGKRYLSDAKVGEGALENVVFCYNYNYMEIIFLQSHPPRHPTPLQTTPRITKLFPFIRNICTHKSSDMAFQPFRQLLTYSLTYLKERRRRHWAETPETVTCECEVKKKLCHRLDDSTGIMLA